MLSIKFCKLICIYKYLIQIYNPKGVVIAVFFLYFTLIGTCNKSILKKTLLFSYLEETLWIFGSGYLSDLVILVSSMTTSLPKSWYGFWCHMQGDFNCLLVPAWSNATSSYIAVLNISLDNYWTLAKIDALFPVSIKYFPFIWEQVVGVDLSVLWIHQREVLQVFLKIC